MPSYQFDIIHISSIILWIILLYISLRDIKRLYRIKPSTISIKIKLLFFIILIILLFSYFILPSSYNIQKHRVLCVKTLKNFSEAQKIYYNKNHRYAITFDELGCSKNNLTKCIKTGNYTYYMNNNKIYFPWHGYFELPYYIEKKKNTIYAVRKISRSNNNLDILSIDYKGHIEVIDSFTWWLPY